MNYRRLLMPRCFLIPLFLCSLTLNLKAQQMERGGGMREKMESMSPEERDEFRARMQSMTDEERQAFRESMGGRRPPNGQDGTRTSGAALESQQQAGGVSSEVAVNWENITLKDCIETLCRDLRMEFIISPSVNVAQEVSVRAGDITAWKRNDKLQLFDAILETAGVQRVQQGRVWVFSPSKLRPVVGADSDEALSGGTPVIGVLKVSHISANNAANILNQIDGKPQRIFPQTGSNILLVAGTKDFLAQTEELLKMVDVPPSVLAHYMIQNADASDLATELNALFSRRVGGDGSTIQFIPIARLNMIVAHNAPLSMHEEISHWINILDSADGTNERITKVYHIQVIDAVTIAKTLNSLYSDLHQQALEKEEKYGTNKTAQSKAAKTNTTKKSSAKTNTAAASGNDNSPAIDYAEEEVIILSDEDTNTIIVNAPAAAHKEVERTLKELDRARKQVLIETVLVEVTLDESTELGVEWAAQQLDIGEVSGTASSLTGVSTGLSALNPTGLITNASDGLTYLLSSSDNMLAMVHAAQEDDRLQVLSSPTVLTRDGMEAEISFGEEVPVEESSVTDGGTTTYSYDYRDAKISLKVTPHIDDNRMVTLALEQELKQVNDESNAAAPTFSTRELTSSLQVFDNQTLVLGGLIQRKDINYTIGIPLLSSIPVVKYLFSRTVKSKEGSEIMMIITPHVIENIEQADDLTAEYQNKVLGSLDAKDIRKIYNLTDEPEAE